jgi:hypothetical protein
MAAPTDRAIDATGWSYCCLASDGAAGGEPDLGAHVPGDRDEPRPDRDRLATTTTTLPATTTTRASIPDEVIEVVSIELA